MIGDGASPVPPEGRTYVVNCPECGGAIEAHQPEDAARWAVACAMNDLATGKSKDLVRPGRGLMAFALDYLRTLTDVPVEPVEVDREIASGATMVKLKATAPECEHDALRAAVAHWGYVMDVEASIVITTPEPAP